jgi:glucose-1-phosphatase
MIEAIIFDFGDVFLNLDKEATFRELKKLGFKRMDSRIGTIKLPIRNRKD